MLGSCQPYCDELLQGCDFDGPFHQPEGRQPTIHYRELDPALAEAMEARLQELSTGFKSDP